MERTSQTHPIRIDFVETQFKGLIGLTFCPGKTQMHPQSGAPWNRSLEQDIYDIKNNNTPNLQKITTIVSLIEDGRFSENEFSTLKVEGLGECIQNHGINPCYNSLEV